MRQPGAFLLGLVWLSSGAFLPLEWIGPRALDLFLYLGLVALVLLVLAKNITGGRYLLSFRPGFWSHYLFFGAVLVLIHLVLTAVVHGQEKDWYQVGRRLFFFSYFLVVPYVIWNSRLDQERLVKHLLLIAIALGVLDILSILSGRQLFVSGFGGYTGWSAAEAVLGNVRLVPVGVDAAIFAGLVAAVRLSAKARGEASVSRSTEYCALISALVVLLLTFSRSLIGAVVVSILFWLTFTVRMTTVRKVKVAGRFGCVVLLVIAVDYLAFDGSLATSLVSRFERLMEVGDSWRSLELEEGWKSFATNPFFGIGLGTPYTHVLSGLADEGYAYNANFDIHNLFAGLLVNFGLLGFAYLLFGIVVFFASKRAGPGTGEFALAVKLLLLVGLMEGLFSGGFINGRAAFWFALLLSFALRNRSSDNSVSRSHRVPLHYGMAAQANRKF